MQQRPVMPNSGSESSCVRSSNIVEQDRRAIKRRTRPMLGFKDFRCARILLSGIELMHMIKKGQMKSGGAGQTPADLF